MNKNDCICDNWGKNIPQLRNLLLLAEEHGQEYQGVPFRFCPWCGQNVDGITDMRDTFLLKKCQDRIESSFFSEDHRGVPQMPNMLLAAYPVSDYRQRTGDILGTLELMSTFAETGTRFTSEFGDIDEPFYGGLERMLAKFSKRP